MINSTVTMIGNSNIIKLEGRIDMSNATQCEELLVTALLDVRKVILDLSKLEFIDSTGIGSIISGIKKAHSNNQNFEVVNVPEPIEQIFELIGVYDVLNSLS